MCRSVPGECNNLMVAEIYSPLISRLRRQLPPKGKPSLHCANKVNRTLNRGLPSRPALIRRLRRQTASSLARKRLMRGDKSLPTQRLQNLMPPSPIRCEAALSKKSPPVQTQKLPCTATATPKAQKIPTHQSGGCRAGKFGEGQGGLEGREPLSRGLPAPPRSSYPPNLPTKEKCHDADDGAVLRDQEPV